MKGDALERACDVEEMEGNGIENFVRKSCRKDTT
jgi:hypothetical protein